MKKKPYHLPGAMSLLLGAAAALALAPSMAATPPTARVQEGSVSGKALPGADAFLGIPFARPPVGDLRWKPPQPAQPWTGARDASQFAASCMQALNPPEGRDPWTPEYLLPLPPRTSEDCLYLNVWAPHGARGRQLPVLVWIHGGGFNEGSGSVPIYDGAKLAQQGVVVVTVNYRLDVFGFLSHPDLVREQGTAGNYGLLDLVAALRWVNANIAAFGGAPGNVTIAGQSAGASAVHDLLVMPAAQGLFARVIAESWSGLGLPRANPAAVGFAAGAAFARTAGAASLAELRALAPQAALDAAVKTRDAGQVFRPVVDGTHLRAEPSKAQTEAGGQFIDTPILTGVNADEGSGFDADYGSWTIADLEKRLDGFGAVAARAREIYAPQGIGNSAALGRELIRDRGVANTALWAKRRLALSRHPIYVYQYTHVTPGPKSGRYGAFHTAEVPYVFGNLIGDGRPYTDADRRVARMMSAYWVNFVRTGDPNGKGLAAWPAFDPSRLPVMRLDVTPAVTRALAPQKEALYEDFVRSGGQLNYR